MLEIVQCENCDSKRNVNMYQNNIPISFIDRTLSFTKEKCKCCQSFKHLEETKEVHFCSYVCFWEWAEKNISKKDIAPIDRLKQYKTIDNKATNMSYIYKEMFDKEPDNIDSEPDIDYKSIINEIENRYDFKEKLYNITYNRYRKYFDISFTDGTMMHLTSIIEKDYPNYKFMFENLFKDFE